jgi:hypothetical protein
MASYTPEQFKELLGKFAQGLPAAVSRATVAAAADVKEQISGRVFNTSGTRDTEGNTRAYKSAEWVDKRKDKGLVQLSTVDLIYDGDLQSSQRIVRENKAVSVKIIGDKNVDKARGNEARFPSKKVFYANKEEVKLIYDTFTEEIANYIQKIF